MCQRHAVRADQDGVRIRWRRQPRRNRAGLVLVAAVLATGALLTAGAHNTVHRSENRYAAQLMDRYADDLEAAVNERADDYGDTTHYLAAAVGARPELLSNGYARITAGLDVSRLPGVAGISFVVPATTAQVATVQKFWRSRGAADLTLRPQPGRSEHAFVVFERALDKNVSIPGLDVLRSPQAATAMNRASVGHTLAISSAYQLIRDAALAPRLRQNSIVFAEPVYTEQGAALPDLFEGWILMPVRGQDFLAPVMMQRGQGAVQVALTESTDNGSVITSVRPSKRVQDASLVRHRTLFVGQHRWQLTVWPTTRLLAATDRGMSRFTLAAGAALTLMLGVMTGGLAGSRNRALQQVDQATVALRRDIARREHVEAQLRESEQQLRHLAFHDPLTGLANRKLFYDRLTLALANHARTERLVALLFIDLDGFKQVNDQYGHHAGDAVLTMVADRLRAGLRTVDTVARFGGDEFAVILDDLATSAAARETAERLIDDVQNPIDVGGAYAHVSASIGIAISRPGAVPDDLVREADTAMYAAKMAGKNRYVEAGLAT
jgi:diguanylate cyclase (GGDEF)-like protein